MAKQLTSQSSKIEEIATLERWQIEAGEQTYLASLLSQQAVNFLRGQIRDDMLCDLYGMYTDAVKAAEELRDNNAQLKATIDAMTDDIAKLQKALEEMGKQNTANYQAYLGTHDRMSTYAQTVAKQTAEILQLKARCWDLSQK